MTDKIKLKMFARLDGQGRIVAGSNIFRKKMPKTGKWVEIAVDTCCDTTTTIVSPT